MRDAPVIPRATVPSMMPAMPPVTPAAATADVGNTTSVPVPLDNVSRSVEPSLIARPTLVAAILTRGPSSVVICSKAKSPLIDWVPSVRRTSVPATRRYGPTGSESVVVLAPRRMTSSTAAVVVLTSSSKEPLKLTSGIVTETVAARRPAAPAPESTKKPFPLVTCTRPSPRSRLTLATAMRVKLLPPVWVSCSMVKSPSSCWPTTSMSTPVALRRRNCPPGRLTRSFATGSVPVLISSKKADESVIPGRLMSTWAARLAAIPALVTVIEPAMSVTWTSAVPPPRLIDPLSTVTTRIEVLVVVSVVWVTEKSPLRLWPRTVSLTLVPVTCRYGPASTARSTVVAPTTKLVSTASVEVLIVMPKSPTNSTSGKSKATSALSVAASRVTPIEAGVTFSSKMKSAPSILLTVTRPSPRSMAPLVTATRIDFTPSASMTCSKAKSAVSVWPATASETLVPTTRTAFARSMVSVTISSPITKTCSTGWLVVLTSMPNVPVKTKPSPGTATSTVPARRPAKPAGFTTKRPSPFVSVAIGSSAAPRLNETLVRATVTSEVPSVLVLCSKAKFPLKLWPAIASVMSVASTRMNGPTGRSRVSVSVPTVKVSFTGAMVVLIEMAKAALASGEMSMSGNDSSTVPWS